MDIGVRELRNRTAGVIEAVQAGERVTLTVRGAPVADIVPHGRRARWLRGDLLGHELISRSADPGLTIQLEELAGATPGGQVTPRRRPGAAGPGSADADPTDVKKADVEKADVEEADVEKAAAGSGLLDTSVFIARERGRPLGRLPLRVAVSVVSIGELELGVLSAPDPGSRARRAETLALARTADPLPISEAVMGAWARLVADCRVAGIQRTVKLTAPFIAATAVEHGLPVVAQDHDVGGMRRVHPGSPGHPGLTPSVRPVAVTAALWHT